MVRVLYSHLVKGEKMVDIMGNLDFFLGKKGEETIKQLKAVADASESSLKSLAMFIEQMQRSVQLGKESLGAIEQTRKVMMDGYEKGAEILKRLQQLGIVK
jgi:hypothetical protein